MAATVVIMVMAIAVAAMKEVVEGAGPVAEMEEQEIVVAWRVE